eukprot:2148940-Pyramimonas_sp.AAC.1
MTVRLYDRATARGTERWGARGPAGVLPRAGQGQLCDCATVRLRGGLRGGGLGGVKQVFSRGQDEEHDGLTPGFLAGVTHQRLVRGRAPRHRGVLVGRVSKVTKRGVQ